MKKFKLVAFVSVFFIAAQGFGGYMANSIAIITDTVHLATDFLGFGLSVLALKTSRRKTTKKYTFGWYRFEIMMTMISVVGIVVVTLALL